MALFHLDDRQVHLKIVYYGPGFGGKTTNLQYLHGRVPPRLRGRWIALKTPDERTLYFDFLPLDLATPSGVRARIHLYTVPGQTRFCRSRRLLLRDADGIVFVADSHPGRSAANLESLEDLHRNLLEEGQGDGDIPLVFQLNKRDLDPRIAADDLRRSLGIGDRPCHEAVASRGEGVVETLKTATKLVLHRVHERC